MSHIVSQPVPEVDPNLAAESGSDHDSSYATVESSTESLSESIKEHIYENGRRYHSFKAGTYNYPNDERENERLDILHHVVRLATGGNLYLAPVDKSKLHNILDVGCGTGIWAMEMGDLHPASSIVGIDLSPTQPLWVPPNVKFQVDDCESTWNFKQPFDYIHIANMIGSIVDWPRLLRQAYDFLKPGGWIEVNEGSFRMESPDGSCPPTSAIMRWCQDIIDASAKTGRSMAPDWEWDETLRRAGFHDVKSKKLVLPIGPWPKDAQLKEIGKFQRLNFLEGVEAISLVLMTKILGRTKEDVDRVAKEVTQDMLNPKFHVLNPYWIVYGRKPLETELIERGNMLIAKLPRP